MTIVVLVLLAAGLLLLDVRLALWVWGAWRDDRDARRDAALMPHLAAAHEQLRAQHARLKELEATAARVQRHLWGGAPGSN